MMVRVRIAARRELAGMTARRGAHAPKGITPEPPAAAQAKRAALRPTAVPPRAWHLALMVGATLLVGYELLASARAKDALALGIGLACATTTLAALRLRRDAPRQSLLLAAAGILLLTGGNALFDLRVLAHELPATPPLGDVLYFGAYGGFFAAVATLTRAPRGRVLADYTDAAIVCLGAFALEWVFVMSHVAPGVSPGRRALELVFPVMDLALLFVVARTLVFVPGRRRVHDLLVAAVLVQLVGDSGLQYLELHGSYQPGGIFGGCWIASYVLIAAAVLHPSLGEISGRPAERQSEQHGRLPVVAVAGFVPPGLLLVASDARSSLDVTVLALTSMAVFALVVLRLSWMFSHLGGQASTLAQALAMRQSLERDLRHQAFHDGLTGLANRALLHEEMAARLAAQGRNGAQVALLLCDLDGFKTVNDSLGHLAGDELLITVARRLDAVVRREDVVARLGGDEFAILMETGAQGIDPVGFAERVVAALRQPVETAGHRMDLSVSVGVAISDVQGPRTGEELLSEADAAMYAAKAKGKGCYALFEPAMRSRALERLELTNGLAAALARAEFQLDFQPVYRLADGRVDGFEALIRWKHPTLGLLAPERFVSLAEETGHIAEIGRWALQSACAQAARWSSGGDRVPRVGVNVSSFQLRDPRFVDDVRVAIERSGLLPDQLVLELTESALMAQPVEDTATLHALKRLGVSLAIDDFGTGYSSLGRLHACPIDILKVDRSFVEPLADSSTTAMAFVATIVRLAHSLGLRTVGEGVEHAAQRDLLRELGCDAAQGYFFSPPLDARTAGVLYFADAPGATAPSPDCGGEVGSIASIEAGAS